MPGEWGLDDLLLERAEILFPQPVAIACARIRRATDARGKLESILKGSEILTRYAATLAIASFSAREDPVEAVPDAFDNFVGPLNFGNFLSVAQAAAASRVDHPLRRQLRQAFQGRYPSGGKAEYGLRELVKLRNALAHDLATLDDVFAADILSSQDKPGERLMDALAGLQPILDLPLFLVVQQPYDDYIFSIRRLLLMGQEQSPVPEDKEINIGLSTIGALYVGISNGALRLTPLMVWDRPKGDTTHSVCMLQTLEMEEGREKVPILLCKEVKYKSVSGRDIKGDPNIAQRVRDCVKGARVPLEPVHLRDGSTFVQEWLVRSKQQAPVAPQQIPWGKFDRSVVQWYGRKLGATGRRSRPPSQAALQRVIADALLGGRLYASAEEIRQLTLLLGKETEVKQVLGRGLLDMWVRLSTTRRWDERIEKTTNIIECLRIAIDFLSKYAHFDTHELDQLQTEGGSADYIAMREALINLFAHQDYQDTRTVAQIRVTRAEVVFYNPGKSLVDETALREGGRSVSRNPLLSEALKRIGFVERAGSGLQQVRRAYRTAHRPEPRIVSNPEANTFELTLQFEAAPPPIDEYWQQRLGVTLTPPQAKALVILVDGPLSVDELADRLGMTADEAEAVCQVLTKEVLIETIEGRVALEDRLRPVAEEARTRGL